MAPGSRVGPFQVERLISAGSMGSVYEATQTSLGRAVALRLIGPEHFTSRDSLAAFDRRQRMAASVHHPNLVSFYEAGEWEGGRFVATRLVRGRSLADLCAQGSPPAAETLAPLAEALRAAHAAGAVHGAVSADNVMVEEGGRPYLADLGLRPGAGAEADARALAAVIAELPERSGRRRAGRAVAIGILGAAAAVAVVLGLASGGDDDGEHRQAAPDSPPGTTALGSRLAPAGVVSLGCDEDPSPNTPACTLAQTSLDGRTVAVTQAGVIRAWAVRGASGDLSLQVIRERGGRSFVAGFSQPESLASIAPRAFRADIPVRPGDRIGVRLAPGGSIGMTLATALSVLERWDGGLTPDSRAPPGTRLEGELMLRADIDFGARPRGPNQLLGRRARFAPAGRILGDTLVALAPGRAGRVVLVQLGDRIALDVVRRERRLARLAVPAADSRGELAELTQACGGAGARGFCLIWRNPGEAPTLTHAYRLAPSGRIILIG